jgi:ferrous iron transport protein B
LKVGCHSPDDAAAVQGGVPSAPVAPGSLRRIALAGLPNVGKSTLFNALTGLHQKVTNYPGVTVERKAGRVNTPSGPVELVDLPGAYGTAAKTPEEEVFRDFLVGSIPGERRPDLLVLVLDATALVRGLPMALAMLETGLPAVIALNQVDAAEAAGITVDTEALERCLDVPVVRTSGRSGLGVEDLRNLLHGKGRVGNPPPIPWRPEVMSVAVALAGPLAASFPGGEEEARRRLPAVLGSESLARVFAASLTDANREHFERERARLPAMGVDSATATAEARYRVADTLAAECTRIPAEARTTRARLDAVLTGRITGTIILLLVFTLIFQAVFAWSGPLMDLSEGAVNGIGSLLKETLPAGLFTDFLTDGLLAGFAGVVVFAPQIAVMFLFVEVLDDSGYLARAAFLLDRLMGRAGLPGRAFLPLMSSFACAIPGVMAARTIPDPKDRMATIFIAPFMSCSARLPVYAMVIGALFSGGTVWGLLSTGAVVMISMYLLGIVAGILSASLLRRTVLRGGRSPLLLEMPAYRWPQPRTVLISVGRRTWQFVSNAGPIIVVLSMVLWALATFPRDVPLTRDYDALRDGAMEHATTLPAGEGGPWLEEEVGRLNRMESGERMSLSYAGRMGKTMEPVLKPLGFDWKIGIGIVASFAAREVFVSTLGIVYASGIDEDADDGGLNLRKALQEDVDPETGRNVFRPLVGISLLVFFVLAMQCISTLAVVRRETGTWTWPLAQLVWMTGLAYAASFVVYQVGSWMGY